MEKLELKGSCFYNLKPSLVGNEADVRGMLFQRHRKECEKDYTQISWCLNCYRVSNGASFSLVKQKNFWYCFVRPEVERILIMILLSSEMALKEIFLSSIFPIGRFQQLESKSRLFNIWGDLSGIFNCCQSNSILTFWLRTLVLLRWENGAFLKHRDQAAAPADHNLCKNS